MLIDGLALGAMPAEVERETSRLRIAGLIHLPLAAEIGIGQDMAARLEASERRAIAAASLVIVTGKVTAVALAGYDVASHLITVVEPGTDRAPVARGSPAGPLQLLCVATVNPGKGHDILLRALAAAAPHGNWRLTCAGSLDRHPLTVQRVRARLRTEGLEARVSLVGDLDAARLAACYDEADLFVLATLHETYGMAVAEALARGLPVVSSTTGAIPDLVSDDAGLLVPPGDTGALTIALSQVLGDAAFAHVSPRAPGVCANDCRRGTTRSGKWLRHWNAWRRMADSLSNWLALREPADVAARSTTLTRAIVDALGRHDQVSVLDLGSGTGSSVRYLAGHLLTPQRWLLVDRDPALLAEVRARMSSWGAVRGYHVTTDRDALDDPRPTGGLLHRNALLRSWRLTDPRIFSGRHLVTASALLDLVSEAWLGALASHCRESGAAVLFALTYTGRSRCSPAEPEDDRIRELMNGISGPVTTDSGRCGARGGRVRGPVFRGGRLSGAARSQ